MLLLLLSACNTEYILSSGFPRQGDTLCIATPSSQLTPVPWSDRVFGWSLDIASTGPRPGLTNLARWAVVGAPGDPEDEVSGFVQISVVNPSTGLIDAANPANRTFAASGVAPVYHFGWAVAAADIRACFVSSLGGNDACGDEVLVGAPDVFSHSTRGRVEWYASDGDALDSGGTIGPFAASGTLNPPGSYPAGAEFGYAIASPRVPATELLPWDISGTPAPWVAISAPGAGKVLLYAVNPASSAPLAQAQELSAPEPGRHFGHALAVGDFDKDGLPDLAVGAPGPGAVPEGRVYVYRGQSGAQPLHGTPLTLDGHALSGSASGGVEEDSFGWSLAAGPVVPGHSGDALMAGAPRSGSDDDGGVCQFTLQASGAGFALKDGDCWGNKFRSAQTAGYSTEHMGWGVAVGNFHNNDDHFADDSNEARAAEVAVSRPGYLGSAGTVELFLTDEHGYVWDEFATSIQQTPSPISGARFGAALAGGYIQRSHWRDLLIGAPYKPTGGYTDGLAQLTKAVESSACTEISATWETEDVEGDPVAFQAFQIDGASPAVHVVLLEPYNMAATEDFGLPGERTCNSSAGGGTPQPAAFFLPAGLELELPGTWTCSTRTRSWTGVDATPILAALGLNLGSGWTMDVTLDYDPGMQTLDIDIQSAQITAALALAQLDDPSCALEPLPIEGALLTPGVCE